MDIMEITWRAWTALIWISDNAICEIHLTYIRIVHTIWNWYVMIMDRLYFKHMNMILLGKVTHHEEGFEVIIKGKACIQRNPSSTSYEWECEATGTLQQESYFLWIYRRLKLINNPFSVIIQPDYLLIIWSPIWTFSVNHLPCNR
jgi:hypothetical protein